MGWPVYTFLTIVGLYVALRAVLGVAIVVTYLLETRPVFSLVPAPEGEPGRPGAAEPGPFNPYEPPASSRSGYPEARNGRAEEMGFTPHGRYVQARGGIYQARFALWESPRRGILAVVIWGTTAKIPVDKTILYTPLEGGRYLVTSDKPTGVQAPWIFVDAIAPGADFGRLVEVHGRRRRSTAPPFSGLDGEADYREIQTRLIQSFVDRGEGYYVDPGRSAVRSTLKGALLAFVRTFRPPEVIRG